MDAKQKRRKRRRNKLTENKKVQIMWNINYILDIASRKIGIAPEEIRKMPWHEIEEKMGVIGVSNYGSRILVNLEDVEILTKQKFLDREKETMEFLKSFYNKKEKRR